MKLTKLQWPGGEHAAQEAKNRHGRDLTICPCHSHMYVNNELTYDAFNMTTGPLHWELLQGQGTTALVFTSGRYIMKVMKGLLIISKTD